MELLVKLKEDVPVLGRQFLHAIICVEVQDVLLSARLPFGLPTSLELLLFDLQLLLVIRSEAQHVQDVAEHRGLDLAIERGAIVEGWADVDLDEPWVQLLIDQHVEPVELVEVVAVII